MRNYSGTSKTVLKSNFIIVYQQLQNAINEYTFSGHTTGNFAYVDAYLAASIHAAMDYIERFNQIKLDPDIISACRYANNTLKHNPRLITHRKASGGFEFPFGSEEFFSFEPIDIVWNFDSSITIDSHANKIQQMAFETQKACFQSIFAGKSILATLGLVHSAISADQYVGIASLNFSYLYAYVDPRETLCHPS